MPHFDTWTAVVSVLIIVVSVFASLPPSLSISGILVYISYSAALWA
jgi:hypothetical protein